MRLPAGRLPWCVPSHSCSSCQYRRNRVLCKAHDLLRMPVDVSVAYGHALEDGMRPLRQQLCATDGASTYLDMINNKDVSADCDPSTKQCNIQIQGFPIQLQTPCQAGDCISEKNPTLNSGEPEYSDWSCKGHSGDACVLLSLLVADRAP